MKIDFIHAQQVHTAHPNYLLTVEFHVEAEIKGDNVTILKVHASPQTVGKKDAQLLLSIPDESTKAGAMFMGLLREKAREAAKQWQAENF